MTLTGMMARVIEAVIVMVIVNGKVSVGVMVAVMVTGDGWQ